MQIVHVFFGETHYATRNNIGVKTHAWLIERIQFETVIVYTEDRHSR